MSGSQGLQFIGYRVVSCFAYNKLLSSLDWAFYKTRVAKEGNKIYNVDGSAEQLEKVLKVHAL